MEYTTSIDVGVKQQWRCWPSPLGKTGEAKWLLPEEKDLIKVVEFSNRNHSSPEVGENNQEIFLLQDGNLYTKTSVDENEGLEGLSTLTLGEPLNSSESKFIDICKYHSIKNKIILIKDTGEVFAVDRNSREVLQNIHFKHNNRVERQISKNKFTYCSSGDDHIVLVDECGKAWSTGKGPQTGHISEHLKTSIHDSTNNHEAISFSKIDFFQGLAVRSISCGVDFTVALVERIEEDDDASVSSPTRASNGLSMSFKNSSRPTSCPLGLPIENDFRDDEENISDDQCYPNSSRSYSISNDDKGQEVELRHKKQPLESNDEADGEDVNSDQDKNVERLARSGIYMNPQDALKFLSNQLSWIGSGIAAGSEVPDGPTKEITKDDTSISENKSKADTENLVESDKAAESSSVSNIGRVAGNIVSAVGQTVVSRISKSFSIDSSSVPSPSHDAGKSTMETIINNSTKAKEGSKGNENSYAEDVADGGIRMDSMKTGMRSIDGHGSKKYGIYEEGEIASDEQESLLMPLSKLGENIESNSSESINDVEHMCSRSEIESGMVNECEDQSLQKSKHRFPLNWSNSSASKEKRRVSFHQHVRSASYGYFDTDSADQSKNDALNKSGLKFDDNIENIVMDRSKKVFDLEVLVWGKGTRGQPGQGDMLDRLQPSTVNELSGRGVIKIVCGSKHCLALTITGMVYGWGDNRLGQACPHNPLAVCSIPKQILLPIGEVASDIAAINDQSFILTDTGSLYSCGEKDSERNSASVISGRNVKKVDITDPIVCNSNDASDCAIGKLIPRKILCSEESLYVSLTDKYLPLTNFKAVEKNNLYRMRQITQNVLEPLCVLRNESINRDQGLKDIANSGLIDDAIYKAKSNLVTSAHRLIDWLTSSVCTSWNLISDGHISQLLLLKQIDNFCELIESYTRHVCDCLVVRCLIHEKELSDTKNLSVAINLVNDLLSNLYYEKTSTSKQNSLSVDNYHINLKKLLLYPINCIEDYLKCLKNIFIMEKTGNDGDSTKNVALEKCIATLKKTKRNVENEQKMMEETIEFWDSSTGRLPNLKIPTRRIILDSRTSPIGLANAGSFSKHWLILMNDVLVHAGYSTHNLHPLQTVWIENNQDLWLESRNSSNSSITSLMSSSQNSKSSEKEMLPNSSSINPSNDKFEISLVMPEDTLTLVASSSENRSIWLNGLQKYINEVLSSEKRKKSTESKEQNRTKQTREIVGTPISRNTSYTFRKLIELKNASFHGSWMYGKLHGEGTLTWLDGSRSYVGQFRQNHKHGLGKMEILEGRNHSLKTIFDGQWKCDKFEGHGSLYYSNGDVYKGSFKDGKPHGHGISKQGKFMGSGASVYVGEWANGSKNGYGVLDDILSGEKYMGMWYNDMKCGSGCVVTVDGVYYEGTFAHNKMTGRGLMIFEDDTVYDGNLADAGVFSGHGILTYANGDHLEGSFYGNYTDGMKFNGTIYKTVKGSPNRIKSQLQTHHSAIADETDSSAPANSIGRYSVIPEQKWSAIFSNYHELLCLPDLKSNYDVPKFSPMSKKQTRSENKRHGTHIPVNFSINTPVVWEQIAIQINQNKNLAATKSRSSINQDPRNNNSRNSSLMELSMDQGNDLLDCLEIIPDYYHTELTFSYHHEVTSYLAKAFTNKLHPLANLLNTVCDCYTATYGGVRIHPRLLRHAVEELNSLVDSLYHIVCAMFPALPKPGQQLWIESVDHNITNQNEGEMVTRSSIIHPHILPKIHSSIFMLYALHYKKDDDEYWLRILKWNRHPDIALLSFLGVDQKFWQLETPRSNLSPNEDSNDQSPSESIIKYTRNISKVTDSHFVKAIETLQQLKTNFTPFEKLTVILETFREVNKTGQIIVGKEHIWSMDDLFPVFQYIVVRARILQLGAEIHMIEDLMDSHLMSGEYGIMFTTLQASYYQILKESLSIV